MVSQEILQERFFEFLRKRNGAEKVLHESQSVLNLQQNAVYKRMSGKTALTALEMVLLADHFNVSIDSAVQRKDFFSFMHPFLDARNSTSFLERFAFYMAPIIKDEEKNSELWYISNELPVFYYMSHEYIFQFYMAVWAHLHWSGSKLVISKDQKIGPQLEKLRDDVVGYYRARPVTEIWNSNMLSNLFQQITFCITIRAFTDVSFIKELVKDVETLVESLRNQTARIDEAGENSRIYINEFGSYLNMVLFETKNLRATFIGYDMPHFIVTHDHDFHSFSKEWAQKIKRRSVLISSEGYQYREVFFMRMENDLKRFKENTENLLRVYYP